MKYERIEITVSHVEENGRLLEPKKGVTITFERTGYNLNTNSFVDELMKFALKIQKEAFLYENQIH